MHRHHGPQCGCHERIVYPVSEEVVNHCCENVVEHIHPSHTTHVNHHLTRNIHYYPHSQSVVNTFDSTNEFGGAFEVPTPPQPTVTAPFTGPGFEPNMMNLGMQPNMMVNPAMMDQGLQPDMMMNPAMMNQGMQTNPDMMNPMWDGLQGIQQPTTEPKSLGKLLK